MGKTSSSKLHSRAIWNAFNVCTIRSCRYISACRTSQNKCITKRNKNKICIQFTLRKYNERKYREKKKWNKDWKKIRYHIVRTDKKKSHTHFNGMRSSIENEREKNAINTIAHKMFVLFHVLAAWPFSIGFYTDFHVLIFPHLFGFCAFFLFIL